MNPSIELSESTRPSRDVLSAATREVAFINRFVEAVTVRPFLNDLRRMKQAAAIFRTQPRIEVASRANRAA